MSAPEPDPLIGATIGGYRVEARLGRGGMGIVYRAFDARLGRPVALKVLSPRLAADPVARARFLREARAAGGLDHAHIATLYEAGEDGPRLYYTMRLLDGESLAQRIARGALPIDEAVAAMTQISSALNAAHAAGIVHRDIKPANVMLARPADGDPRHWSVKVLDFGLARIASTDGRGLTEAGEMMGTVEYMAPEQLRGEVADHRADLWALGVTAYEMLAGVRPFVGSSRPATASLVLTAAPRPLTELRPETPRWLARLVHQLLGKPPRDRPQSASEVIRSLEEAGHGHEPGPSADARVRVPVRTPGAAPSSASGQSRARWLAGALVAAAASGLLLAALRASPAGPPVPPPPPRRGVAMTDHPAPRSSSAEAVSLYRQALADSRAGPWRRAEASLIRAVTLDPELAPAHLRLALLHNDNPPEGRAAYRRAEALRDRLDDRDRGLLDAFEPYFQREPGDLKEAIRRLDALLGRFPEDAELAFERAVIEGDLQRGLGLVERAHVLDPESGRAWSVLGEYLAYLGRVDRGREELERCVAGVSRATRCLEELIRLDEEQGECADLEARARRWIIVAPEEDAGYQALADALVALGRPIEATREVLARKAASTPRAEHAVSEASDRRQLALLDGDFAAAAVAAQDEERLVAASAREIDHARLAMALAAIRQEIGDLDGASRGAAGFLARRDAWEIDPRGDDWALWHDATGWMLSVAGRGGALPAQVVEQRRATLLQGWEAKAIPVARSFIWIHQIATSVETRDEALLALAALPRYQPLAPYKPMVLVDDSIGRTLLLGGRVEEALPHLERAAKSCYALPFPIEHTRAHFFLGQAREARGDGAGACVAYQFVLDRWGRAKPRSVTADRARSRVRALRCR